MGSVLSSTTNQTDSHNLNSSSEPSNPTTVSSDPETPDSVTPNQSDQATKPTEENENGDTDQGEEDEGECGFCLFMKGGGCKDAFVDWENCVKEVEIKEEDVVSKCYDATKALRECMRNHPDYYEPILKAEQAAEEEVQKELEKKKGSQESDSDGTEKKETEKVVDSKDLRSEGAN